MYQNNLINIMLSYKYYKMNEIFMNSKHSENSNPHIRYCLAAPIR